MNAISLSSLNAATPNPAADAKSAEREKNVKQAFQKFVAGTFYQQMFKSLRKMHDKPAYFHGGQAEEMFQNQMDMQVAENLAEKNGDSLSNSLYQAFAQKLKIKMKAGTPDKSSVVPLQTAAVESSRL